MSTTTTTPPPRYTPSIYNTPFAQLPDPKRVWVGAPSSTEEGLGRLNLLTPDVVAAAAREEIRTGIRVGLGWDMNKLEHSQFGRPACRHEVVEIAQGKCFDDWYGFNPQQSSQWDGLRHHSQPASSTAPSSSSERIWYGGTTKEEIIDRSSTRIGTNFWAEKGITGRGILLDYVSYAKKHNITYSNFSTHRIPLSILQDMCKAANLTPRKGDILLIRMGLTTEWSNAFTPAQQIAYAQSSSPEHAGVEPTLAVLEWLWDSGFAALAGDMISWEVYPTEYEKGDVSLHEYVLAGWGMPMGEIFDLEALARTCEELGRWSFFFVSVPLNMGGGVSSPPNAVAIF